MIFDFDFDKPKRDQRKKALVEKTHQLPDTKSTRKAKRKLDKKLRAVIFEEYRAALHLWDKKHPGVPPPPPPKDRAKIKAERKAKRKAEKRQHRADGKAERNEERKQQFEKAWRAYGAKPGQVITMRTPSGDRVPITIK